MDLLNHRPWRVYGIEIVGSFARGLVCYELPHLSDTQHMQHRYVLFS